MYTCIAAVGIVVSLFIKKNTLSRQHEAAKTGLDAQQSSKEARKQDKEEKEARKNLGRTSAPGDEDLEIGMGEMSHDAHHEPKA